MQWVYSKDWGSGRERKGNKKVNLFTFSKKFFCDKLLWIKNFQSDLTEAFSKLNQVPLALFPSDENPDKNFFCICIRMTGTYFYPFIV
jgi:hypothetical protein